MKFGLSSLSCLLLAAAASAVQAVNLRFVDKNQDQLLKSTNAQLGPQLVIDLPQNNDILTANSSFIIKVDSSPSPSAPDATTTFTCTSGSFQVTSPINQPLSSFVPAGASGTCTVISSADGYTSSSPITVFINVPMYYEGTDDSVLHQGEVIDILVRPSNNVAFNTNFRIQCGSVIKNIPITTTVVTQFTIPPELKGECTFTTPNPPSPYLPIDPVNVDIEPTIQIISPTQGTVFPAGSFVTVRTLVTDGSNPTIQIDLTCESVLAASLTQPANTAFIFAPNPKIYGNCVISIADNADYYTGQSVSILYNANLNFVSPVRGSVAATGLPIDLQVTGTSGPSSTSVTVTVVCEVGGAFTKTVDLNQLTSLTFAPGYLGRCTLVASVVGASYFNPAATFITVYVPLTPQESAEEAQQLSFFSGTIDLTSPQ